MGCEQAFIQREELKIGGVLIRTRPKCLSLAVLFSCRLLRLFIIPHRGPDWSRRPNSLALVLSPLHIPVVHFQGPQLPNQSRPFYTS